MNHTHLYNPYRTLLGPLPAILLLLLCLTVASAQATQTGNADIRTHSSWFGVSLGYPNSLHVGGYDLIAEDVHLRADVSLYLLPLIAYFEFWLEGSVKALYDAGNGLYVGGGPLIVSGVSAVPVVGAGWGGTYLGLDALVGYEPGEGGTRFFIEGGLSGSFKISGEAEASAFRLRPRLALGLNIPF